jgi:hypothetical protein
MNKLLKSAIDNLAIVNVNLRDSVSKMGDGFNSLNVIETPKKLQSFRRISKIEVIEMVKEGEEDVSKIFYSFHYDIGSRLVAPEKHDHTDDEDSSIVCIEATFEAIYRAKVRLSKDELEAFAAKNVGYNVWPYWREYLQATCSRMGVPAIKVPFYQFRDVSDLPPEEQTEA